MDDYKVNILVKEISELYKEEATRAFPYEGCFKLLGSEKNEYENFTADLNTYFYDIASHCYGIKKVLNFKYDKLLLSKKVLEKSFFEKHPCYESLLKKITHNDFPDLYSRLILHDQLRLKILELISKILVKTTSEKT